MAGIGQGIAAPMGELLISIVITVALKISESLGGIPWYLTSVIVLFFIFDFIRNIALGLSHSQFAAGNLIGNVIGIILFFGIMYNISPTALIELIVATVVLGISYGIGLYFYRRSGAGSEVPDW